MRRKMRELDGLSVGIRVSLATKKKGWSQNVPAKGRSPRGPTTANPEGMWITADRVVVPVQRRISNPVRRLLHKSRLFLALCQ